MESILIEKKKKKPYKRRLLVNIPDEIHSAIMDMARHKGTTITGYVLQAVAEQILKDKFYE